MQPLLAPHGLALYRKYRPWWIMVAAIFGLCLLLALVSDDSGFCRRFGREHGVRTSTFLPTDTRSCRMFDATRGQWISVHSARARALTAGPPILPLAPASERTR